MKRLVLLTVALLSAGCAKKPDEIAATPIAPSIYLNLSCQELLASRLHKESAQAQLEQAQQKAAERDTAAMGVLHVPIASMAGQDREEDVARGKGELIAIDAAIRSNGC